MFAFFNISYFFQISQKSSCMRNNGNKTHIWHSLLFIVFAILVQNNVFINSFNLFYVWYYSQLKFKKQSNWIYFYYTLILMHISQFRIIIAKKMSSCDWLSCLFYFISIFQQGQETFVNMVFLSLFLIS